MNKAEFISAVADAAGSGSKSDATAHVEAMINVITNTLKNGNAVSYTHLTLPTICSV